MDRGFSFVCKVAVLVICVVVAGCNAGSGTAALRVATTSLPTGYVNRPYYFLIQESGGTAPYTWTQISGGAMPPGVTFSSGGAFAGTPTQTGTFGPYTFEVTDANSNTAGSTGLSITVKASTLSVTTTSLPGGTIGTAYSATLEATGGTAPYSWSFTGPTSPATLPPGLSTVSGSGVITGTPTTAGTYGPYFFTVTDATTTTASSSALTIVVSGTPTAVCTPVGNEGALTSTTPYAFLLKGTDVRGNPIEIAGGFTTNGQGGIASAVADYNGFTDGPQTLQVNLATSSYSFSSTGQGCLYLAFSGLATGAVRPKDVASAAKLATGDAVRGRRIAKPDLVAVPIANVQFSFYLSQTSGVSTGGYTTGRIIESDTSTSGTNAAGFIHVQDPTAFSLSALQANYAFGVDGWTANTSGAIRTAMAGAFTNASGTLSAGFADVNVGGTTSGEIQGTAYGSVGSIDATTGRGSGSYYLTTPTGKLTYDFTVYVVNASDLILISTDIPSATTPMLAGRALASNASYGSAPLNGYYLLASEGYQSVGVSIGNIAQIGTINATSAGAIPTATIYSNYAGTYSQEQYPGSSYSVEAASGRVTVSGILSNPPVAYLTNTTATPDEGIVGFLVGTDPQASSGVLLNQTTSAPNYSLASVSGAYPVGTAEDVDGKNGSFLADFSFNGAGAYTISSSQTTGTLTNVPSLGSIAINADGSGSLDGGNFPLVTNGQVIFAIPNSGDPLLFVFEEGTLTVP